VAWIKRNHSETQEQLQEKLEEKAASYLVTGKAAA
jgi:hypothetical protein